jgi:hypothetical protein
MSASGYDGIDIGVCEFQRIDEYFCGLALQSHKLVILTQPLTLELKLTGTAVTILTGIISSMGAVMPIDLIADQYS